MNAPLLQLLVLAGIAIFLILRLRSVLGTREGFEKPERPLPPRARPDLTVVEGGPDRDITDHVDEDSNAAKALAEMKKIEPSFSVGEFLSGARGAYEMILMGFEKGEMEEIRPFLAPEVFDGFKAVVDDRTAQGLSIDATFVGLSSLELKDASFDPTTKEAELTVGFVGELTSVVRNQAGEVVEGDANTIVKQRDIWVFGRQMGSRDPNWQLVATEG